MDFSSETVCEFIKNQKGKRLSIDKPEANSFGAEINFKLKEFLKTIEYDSKRFVIPFCVIPDFYHNILLNNERDICILVDLNESSTMGEIWTTIFAQSVISSYCNNVNMFFDWLTTLDESKGIYIVLKFTHKPEGPQTKILKNFLHSLIKPKYIYHVSDSNVITPKKFKFSLVLCTNMFAFGKNIVESDMMSSFLIDILDPDNYDNFIPNFYCPESYMLYPIFKPKMISMPNKNAYFINFISQISNISLITVAINNVQKICLHLSNVTASHYKLVRPGPTFLNILIDFYYQKSTPSMDMLTKLYNYLNFKRKTILKNKMLDLRHVHTDSESSSDENVSNDCAKKTNNNKNFDFSKDSKYRKHNYELRCELEIYLQNLYVNHIKTIHMVDNISMKTDPKSDEINENNQRNVKKIPDDKVTIKPISPTPETKILRDRNSLTGRAFTGDQQQQPNIIKVSKEYRNVLFRRIKKMCPSFKLFLAKHQNDKTNLVSGLGKKDEKFAQFLQLQLKLLSEFETCVGPVLSLLLALTKSCSRLELQEGDFPKLQGRELDDDNLMLIKMYRQTLAGTLNENDDLNTTLFNLKSLLKSNQPYCNDAFISVKTVILQNYNVIEKCLESCAICYEPFESLKLQLEHLLKLCERLEASQGSQAIISEFATKTLALIRYLLKEFLTPPSKKLVFHELFFSDVDHADEKRLLDGFKQSNIQYGLFDNTQDQDQSTSVATFHTAYASAIRSKHGNNFSCATKVKLDEWYESFRYKLTEKCVEENENLQSETANNPDDLFIRALLDLYFMGMAKPLSKINSQLNMTEETCGKIKCKAQWELLTVKE